jgi:hypothetical protein
VSVSFVGRLRRRLSVVREVVTTRVQVDRALRKQDFAEAVAAVRGPVLVSPGVTQAQLDEAVRLGRAVVRVMRWWPGDRRCLAKTLVVTGMLARRNVGCRVVIGVRVSPGFGAHAWPELGGRALLPPIEEVGKRLVEI